MKIDVNRLEPGMVLIEDVIGKSGKPIMKKETVLTEVEITFLKKFMVSSVHVASPRNKLLDAVTKSETTSTTQTTEKQIVIEKEEVEINPSFRHQFEMSVQQFKRLFQSWQGNLPVNMYEIRRFSIPIFEKVIDEPFTTVANLIRGNEKDLFYYKNVAVSLLSVYLANQLNYEKKEWLQIGFASLLCDCGMAKLKPAVYVNEIDPRHPVISYDMVKGESTLTKLAKFAVLQHHEYLDGTGYPLKLSAIRIHPYAKIITVADTYYSQIIEGKKDRQAIEAYMTINMAQKLDQNIVKTLLANF